MENTTVTILVGDKVHDGTGGFYAKGAKVELPADVAAALKERGLAK